MANGQAHAQMSAWVAKAKHRIVAVRNESAQRVVEVMQTPGPSAANPGGGRGGNMPIATGFLRASLLATTGSLPAVGQGSPGGDAKFNYDPGQVGLVIAGAALKDKITVVYTANYARHVNYGARGRAGRQFVGLAAQQWSRIVTEVCAQAEAGAYDRSS